MKWNKNTLGELVNKHGGRIQTGPFGSQLHQHDYKLEGIPVVMPKDIINDRIDTGSIARISEDDADRLAKHKMYIGDLVIPRRGDINKRAICKLENEGWLCGTGCLKIRLNDEIVDPDYLYYYFTLSPVVESILNRAVGSTMLNLSGAILSSTELIYPPLPTQRKIVSILSAYDELIENNLMRIKLLEEKTFLSYKLIVKSEKLEKYILSDFGEVITGKTPSTAVYDYFGDDVPFIKTPDMHNQIFIDYTEQSLSELGAKSQEKKYLPPLTLCVSCIGTAGVVGITSKPSQTNQQINSIIFSEPRNVYFFYALMSQMKEQLEALGSNGSTFTNVNKSKFENMEVFIPKQKVLDEFANGFEAPFKLILALQKQNTKLRQARDILLPRLMSGEIEV